MELIWFVIIPACVLFVFLGTLGKQQDREAERRREAEAEKVRNRLDRRGW